MPAARTGDLRGKIDLIHTPKAELSSTQAKMRRAAGETNDFAKAYAVSRLNPDLGLATELDARNGKFTGYIEPVFDHMSIFNPQHDADNPIDFIWQGLSGLRLIPQSTTGSFHARSAIGDLR